MQKTLPITVLAGALFAIQIPCGAVTPTLTAIYSFPGAEGAYPEAGLVLNNGALFGTTYTGGTGWGTVFGLSQSGGVWNISDLYTFTGLSDGANPRGGVVFTSHGAIIGTTEQGGANGYGVVFQLSPVGGGKYSQNVIHNFTGADGANPEAGLTLSPKSGAIYGTTDVGGTYGYGTVFSLTPATGGTWTYNVIYNFSGAPGGCGTTGNPACDGANPLGVLTLSTTGVLYGTTYGGGTGGWGTVFKLAQSAGVWTETVLYSFNGANSGVDGGTACGTSGQPACDGGAPAGNLVLNAATGVLYGTTTLGGLPTGCPMGGYVQGCGVVFQLKPPTPPATAWTESLLYTFTGPAKDGMLPSFNLASASSGALYGTAYAGGNATDTCFPASYKGCGMVYLLRPPTPPSSTWTKSNLAVFSINGDQGGGPNGVILGTTGGVLYGSAYVGGTAGGYGTIFQVTF